MDDREIRAAMHAAFTEQYGSDEGTVMFFAPGRVNLIGEHTDYNGGHVFPCALTRGTYALVRQREDRTIRYYSLNQKTSGFITKELDQITAYNADDQWTNYPNAAVYALEQHGHHIKTGYDAVIAGNIPVGSGLSSSASLLVLTGSVLRAFNQLDDVTNQELALLARFAEQKYIGLNCGIMDQFAIAMGKKDHAIFLDTADLSYKYVPVVLDDASLIIMNTNKPRELQESKYNDRVQECTQALHDLQKVCSITSLGELSSVQFEELKGAITDETCRKRAKHAVYENERTLLAAEALQHGELEEFGKLMNASHVSLRDDYEVSGIELDTLAETAWTVPGVIGARMTGAGFGGCGVALVRNDAVETFLHTVQKAYVDTVGYEASFFRAEIADGPIVIDEAA